MTPTGLTGRSDEESMARVLIIEQSAAVRELIATIVAGTAHISNSMVICSATGMGMTFFTTSRVG